MIYLRQSRKFYFEEDPFCEIAQGGTMILNEALFLMNFIKPNHKLKIQLHMIDLFDTIISSLSNEVQN